MKEESNIFKIGQLTQLIRDLLKGVIIGVANIIPGVSGGTMALVLGIYGRMIGALNSISFSTVKNILGILRFNKTGLDNFKYELKRIDAFFLMRISAGALIAVVVLARLMMYLLVNWHDPTYGFFFGLVIASAIVPFKLIQKKNLKGLFAFQVDFLLLIIGDLALHGFHKVARFSSEGHVDS